jgi:hypothetical protein
MFGDFDVHLNPLGESRDITVKGDDGAHYDLEVTDEDGKYYNFKTGVFGTYVNNATNKLSKRRIEDGTDIVNINFPAPAKLITYTVRLIVNHCCGPVKLRENKVGKRGDDTIAHNKSIGGSGGVMEKKIFGSTTATFTLSCNAPTLSDSGEAWQTATPRFGTATGAQTRTGCYKGEDFTLPFSITLTATSGKSIRILRDPNVGDLCAIKTITIGGTPDTITNEDIYPLVTTTDNTNAAMEATRNVTMTTNVVDKMELGDKVTGDGIASTSTITVTGLAVGDNAKIFQASEVVSIDSGITLSFSKAKHHKWPVNDIVGIGSGMIVGGDANSANFQSNTKISSYTKHKTTSMEQPQVCESSPSDPIVTREVSVTAPAVEDGSTITYSEENIIGDPREISANNGSVTFSPAQNVDIASDSSVKIYAYGYDQIKKMTNMGVYLEDVELTPTEITTTISDASATGSASLNDFDVASVTGIMDDVSVVHGAGISNSTSNPVVTTISSSNLTLTPGGHTVTNGETLTFTGASNIITITGTLRIKNFTTAASSTLYFDVERFLHSA